MLGERIREIRKKKKMTLEALAGGELTKGMLSLIENNKANPSMESLTYIAKRLEVDISDLLESVSTSKLREVLEKAEKLYFIKPGEKNRNFHQIIGMLESYIANLTQGYESARLLEIYSRCLFHVKKSEWQDIASRAAKLYEEMNLSSRRAGIGIFRSMARFLEHDYSQALTILLQERMELEANHAIIDPMTRVDLDYHEAILHFAVGDFATAEGVMQSAIDFSKENRIFYRIDDLYRLAAAHGVMTQNEEKRTHYTMKLKQYGEFADDLQSLLFYELFHVMALNMENHEYLKALEMIEEYLSSPKMEELFGCLYSIEKGKSLYGLGRYDDALHCFEQLELPSDVHHPFDFALFYIMDTYKALTLMKLGNLNEAYRFAQQSVKNFKTLPHTRFNDFALKAWNLVKQTMNE